MIVRCGWALALALCAACAARQDVAEGIEGCYALELGEWNPPRQAVDEPFQTPPAVFELLDSLGTESFEEGQRLVRPKIEPGDFRGGSASWRWLSEDSVRVVWTTGFVMVDLELEVLGDRLEGVATARTDAVVPGAAWPTTSATATRKICETG
ncbi:MAG TPA: hypothetical protein VLA33_05530 [Gemmatimonadota bacterium]|nr:hypothetical protein [Gemmatimonadota bacterium]